MFVTIDSRRKVIIPGNEKETIDFSAKHFIDCAKTAIASHGSFFVALSGGSTPKKIYETLTSNYKTAIDWGKVFLFWSDERAVPPDHPDSNYKMAMDAGFKTLPIPASNIFRMKGEGDIKSHATDYEIVIKNTLGRHNFDLIMLGIGEDGHTASLFPNTKGLTVEDKWVIANEVPQKKTCRMTFTYPLINSAENIVFYALGENKQEIIKKILITNLYPASFIGTSKHPAIFVLDASAGRFL